MDVIIHFQDINLPLIIYKFNSINKLDEVKLKCILLSSLGFSCTTRVKDNVIKSGDLPYWFLHFQKIDNPDTKIYKTDWELKIDDTIIFPEKLVIFDKINNKLFYYKIDR